MVPLYITVCREKVYSESAVVAKRRRLIRAIYFFPTAGDIKKYRRFKILISLMSGFFLTLYFVVSGFECICLLFRKRRYKVVPPPAYATRIRTYGQSSSAACFDQHSDKKLKIEMKTNSNCAPDGSFMLANGLSE